MSLTEVFDAPSISITSTLFPLAISVHEVQPPQGWAEGPFSQLRAFARRRAGELLTIDNESWLEDVENIKNFYKQVGDRVPAELYEELAALEANLKK